VLVTGSNRNDRDAVFNGFNTPLLPDVLVCTEVGQEGIDLHRHCRHVIHYDLGWNPAATEQRTGRIDRIGSKAVRERKIASRGSEGRRMSGVQLRGLDVALPYLAGTYDERMFDRLRTRAQVFDILTGGDPTADQDSAALWLQADSEGQDDGRRIVPLPRQMLDDLRLDLAIPLSFDVCGTLAKSLEE
jgi:superfamily II DNA/RNA helicase